MEFLTERRGGVYTPLRLLRDILGAYVATYMHRAPMFSGSFGLRPQLLIGRKSEIGGRNRMADDLRF